MGHIEFGGASAAPSSAPTRIHRVLAGKKWVEGLGFRIYVGSLFVDLGFRVFLWHGLNMLCALLSHLADSAILKPG